MQLANLIERLPERSVARSSLADPHCDVYNVAFLTDVFTESPRGDVLYFCDSILLPASVPETTYFNCIIVDGGDAPEALVAQPNVNLIWLANGINLFACYNAIQTAFINESDLTAVLQRLLAAHFSNQGLQFLIEEAASALGNPIVVVDPTYQYIAYHLGSLPNDNSRLAHVMNEEMVSETLLEEGVNYIRDSYIDSTIGRNKGPLVHYNKFLDCNTMTMAVMVRGICIAHVMMMEYAHLFRDLDREAFVQLSNFVGQELQKSEIWSPSTGELGSYFLENLLGDRSPSVAVTRRRLKALDFHPKPLLYVVCLHAPGEGLTQIQVEHIAGQLRPVLHHSLYTKFHQHFVALISRDLDNQLSERTLRRIHEVATLNGLTAGVSNSFRAITETRNGYDQARAAIRYGTLASRIINDEGVFQYRDYAYMQAVEQAGKRMNLLNICHPSLLSLMDYDESHGCELVETLFCYLQTACSTSRSASLLNLHKNTMLYRLGRIREVLGMDLSSGEDIFILQTSFRVLINLGLFTPRCKLDRTWLRTG